MTRTKTNEKIGDWMMDVAKYVVTAVIISSFLGAFGEPWEVYTYGLIVALFFFFTGLLLFKKK